MARMAHPQAMQPSRPGSTRTAPALMPHKFPAGGRYLSYILFGASSLFYVAVALGVLRIVYALGTGPEAWAALQENFRHPAYIAFHAVTFVVLIWVGWRFLIKLSAKANPRRIGPLRPPPLEVFPFIMGALWIGASALVLIVLWGIFP